MFVFRSVTILAMSLVGAVVAVMPVLISALALLIAQHHPSLSLNEATAGLLSQVGLWPVSGIATWWLAALAWAAAGGLVLKYQLHLDRVRLSVARREGTSVAVSFSSLADLFLRLVLALIAGPLLILAGLLRRPDYAYVAPEGHYRHRLVFADARELRQGRRSRRVPLPDRASADAGAASDTASASGPAGRGARIVFDSRASILALALEILVWTGLLYAVAFDHTGL